MNRLRQILTTLALGMLLLLAACSQEVTTPPPPPEDPPPQAVEEPPAAPVYPYTAPFTGMGSEQRLEDRPIMVMINNHPDARPQSGLDQADIVYEILLEGEVTRFEAIYQSRLPEVIGPVRSIRPYNIEIANGFDAVMVHAGWSPEAKQMLENSDYPYINEINNSAYFWREKFRKAPHNLYTKPELIKQAIADKKFRTSVTLPQFRFLPHDAKVEGGEAARRVDIKFHSLNQVAYEYNDDKQRYLRYTNGELQHDLTSNQPLEVTNLLVLAAKHRVIDQEGRRDVDINGPGDGFLFQHGQAKQIKWKRSGGIIRAYEDQEMSKEIELVPGNTWVHLIPDSPGLAVDLKFE